jgi:phenol hydroxylase P5 protein
MVDTPRDCSARVSDIRWLAPQVVEADLALIEPAFLPFQAGQWISIPLGPKSVRAYSIASPPSRGQLLTLSADVAPGGPGSRWFKRLTIGEQVTFKAPNGDFVVAKGSGRSPLFIAEEIGVVPIRSMLLDLLEGDVTGEILLLFGAAKRELLVYHEEFEALAARRPQIRYVASLETPLWELVERTVISTEGKEAYLSGGGLMITEVRARLMGRGMERKLIKREKFW